MRRIVVGLLIAIAGPGCGDGDTATRTPLVVLAAASLTESFAALETAYESAHTDVDVRLSFAGSQVLAAQVREGAPADVLVTADEATMHAVAGELETLAVIARNQLAIVTAAGNPKGITRLSDLARPDVTVVLAGPKVPVGKAARSALAAAGVVVKPVSEEPDVKAVVSKVRLGEADAGIAYVTDVRGTEVAGSPLPGTSNSYPAAVLRSAPHAAAARAFVAFLTSASAQRVLGGFGFLPPA